MSSQQLAWQQRHRLCTLCSEPATEGTLCSRHAESQRAAKREYSRRRRRREAVQSGQRTLFDLGGPWESSPKPSSRAGVAYARSGSSGTESAKPSRDTAPRRSAGELLGVDDDTPLPVRVTLARRSAEPERIFIDRRLFASQEQTARKKKPTAKAKRRRRSR